jgi:Leucine-rich repeat (LRR) protein
LTDIICNNNDIKKLELNLPALKNITVNNNNLYILRAITENIQNIETFNALNNENLCCIEIDDVTYAEDNFTNIDEQTTFSLDCNFNALTYVPDDSFEQALIDLGYDDFLDDYVNTVYLKNVEQLLISSENLEENKIRDLTGIEGFSDLKTLILAGHKVTDLDLSSNTNLEKIVAQFNEIESVILPETERLTEVDFWGNKLSTIDVSNLPNLTKLALYNNELSSINTSQNPLLETLNVSLNTLNSIDITNNTQLTSLYITLAGLTELDVSQNINLETLDCTNNALTTLDVTQNNSLRTLNCSSNNTIESLDVSNNRLLETLNCMQNDIAVLDISNNIRLTDFDARINNLTCIQVWDVDFANQNWSEKIDALASFGESCYTTISDEKFEQALIDKEFDDTLDGYILTSRANEIEQLIIPSKQISDLSGIEDFTALTFLNVSNNNLTSLDVSHSTSLSSLIVDNNELERLDISTNTSLFSLTANNNYLTCIQVYDEAFANTNWSKGIDATASFSEDCDDMWTVEVDKDVKNILAIISGIDKDNDGEITLKEAKEFSGNLDLSNKNIKNIEGLQAFENITSLNLSGNKLKDLSALTGKTITLVRKTTGKKKQVSAKASKLETLIVSDNSFETLNLEELKDLKVINVSNNPNLATLSVKNGTNASVTSFNATNTPNLSCIIVDNKNANYLNAWAKDNKASFVANLNDCRNKVLSTSEFVSNDVKIYPNPVTNILSVESVRDLDYIEIYNLLGKRLLRTEKTEVHFSNYTSGIYLLKIISNNQIVTKRVVKE